MESNDKCAHDLCPFGEKCVCKEFLRDDVVILEEEILHPSLGCLVDFNIDVFDIQLLEGDSFQNCQFRTLYVQDKEIH